MSAKSTNIVIFITQNERQALLYWLNRSKIALRRRGYTSKEINQLNKLQSIADKSIGQTKFFK